jgi:hypothetical protein
MRNIISGEIFKLRKSKYLWVGIGLAAGIMIMVVAILFGMSSTMIEFESILPKSTVEIFGIYHECYIYMIIAFMSCLLVNDDMRTRTIDTMIQAGGRLKIYLSKIFMGLIISFSVVLTTQISMMILGCIFIKDFGLWGMSAGFFIGFLAMQTFIGLLSSSISIALAFFVRKVTVALPVCVLFEFVVLGMVDGLSFFNENLKVIGNFIPGRMSMLFSAYEYYTQQNVVIGVIVGLLILAATSAIGMLHFKKADF